MNHIDPSLAVFTKHKETYAMSTALVISNIQLPAHLQNSAAMLKESMLAAGGIKAGGFPSISIKGSKFHVKKDGETKMITDPRDPQLPLMKLRVVIVGWNPDVSKTYYEGDYVTGDDREPDCRSDDGKFPDADIATPQHTDCTTCPQNMWGSKVSKASGKDVKACSDNKRLAVIAADALESEALALQVTPSSLKDFKAYADLLNSKSIPVQSVVTELTFDPQASYPRLQFGYGGFLEPDQYIVIERRALGHDVAVIKNPRVVSSVAPRTTQTAISPSVMTAAKLAVAAATNAPAAPAPATPNQKPAETPAPAPLQMAPPADTRLDHLDPAMKAVVVGAGGADSPVGIAILTQFPAPKPVAPVAVDPYALVPEALRSGIKAAVEANGGPDGVVGKGILGAFVAPAPEKKTRTKKTADEGAKQALGSGANSGSTPEAPSSPAPVAPLSTAPAANVVSALAGDLNALLGAAMKVKG